MRSILTTLFTMLALLESPAWCQTSKQIEELRRQVEALEKGLRQTGRADSGNSRVTEIGGSRTRTREGEFVVRIYDVSDLFQVAPPYLAEFQSDLAQVQRPGWLEPGVSQGEPTGATGFGGGGGGFFAVPNGRSAQLFQAGGGSSNTAPSNRITTDSLIDAITSTISPSSWSESGGPGTIAKLGNSLVVSADPEMHEKIEALLALFRQRWGTLRTVSVRAYWLWLDDTQLAGLLAGDKKEGGGAQGFGMMDAKGWQALLAELQKPENKSRPGYRAAVTCYNGQTVNTQAGAQSLVVTQIEPEIARGDTGAPQGRVAYRPVVSVVQEGAVLQVTPSATYSGKYVVLDIHSRVTRLQHASEGNEADAKADAAQARPAVPADAASPQQVVAALDRPRLVTQRLSTTLRLPTNQPMLIGGMTVDSEPQPGEPTLYLFAIVSVQELRDDLRASPPPDEVDPPVDAAADPNPDSAKE